MAHIYKKKKKKKQKVKSSNEVYAHKYVYNTPRWKKLRLSKLVEDPLCEECKRNEHIKAATQVHHITKFMSARTNEQRILLGFQYSNLMSVCDECHNKFHK